MHTGRPSTLGERKDRLGGEARIRVTAANILTLSLLRDGIKDARKSWELKIPDDVTPLGSR